MTADQGVIFVVLLATMAMFIWSSWRHDRVALGALLVCAFAGLRFDSGWNDHPDLPPST